MYGSARLTSDVDVTVDPGEHSVRTLLSALESCGFTARVKNVHEFAERTQVVPARHQASKIDVDLILAGPGPEQLFLDRAVRRTIDGVRIPVVSAEDLVAMKVLAGRAKDMDDVADVLAAQGRKLRVGQVRRTLRSFEDALDRSDLVSAFDGALSRVRRVRR